VAVATSVVGSYPKPPEEGRPFALRTALHALERGEIEPDDLEQTRRELAREVIAEQEAAGIDIVTDGQVRWDDLVTPFARRMSGFRIGGLLRFFDNNVYYRRPVCVGPVEWRGPASVDDWRWAASVATRPVKAVLPGPVTFARLSVDEFYDDHRAFVEALSAVLAQEAFELEAAGAPVIQIDEPSLLGAPEDIELAVDAIGRMTADLGKATTILCTYFGDAKRLGDSLFRIPVDVFGLDFISEPGNDHLVEELPAGRGLQAGVVDARNTKLEPTSDLRARIEALEDAVGGAERLTVCPSAGLEFLPREKARAKLERLAEAASQSGP
jgi:5-methyltetrahydropteroyltriglutamate--homocysteine methyltransferase